MPMVEVAGSVSRVKMNAKVRRPDTAPTTTGACAQFLLDSRRGCHTRGTAPDRVMSGPPAGKIATFDRSLVTDAVVNGASALHLIV